MARPVKQTVDYFPHRCAPGKTLFILETKYGDKGYAFWFKLLELLGSTEGHAYQYGIESDRRYLEAKTRTDTVQATEILSLLADLDAIDADLWCSRKIIWSDNFIAGIKDAYRNRTITIPVKPVSDVSNTTMNGVSDVRNPQRRVNKTKVDKSRVNIVVYGEFQNVSLSEQEHQKLVDRFGAAATAEKIERLSAGIASKGYKYRSHYAAILSWSRRDNPGNNGHQDAPAERTKLKTPALDALPEDI